MAIPARSDAVEQGRLRAAFPLSGDLLAIHVLFFEWLAEAGEQEPSECPVAQRGIGVDVPRLPRIGEAARSEEHPSELQSLMRISYAVFCLKQKNTQQYT